MDNIHYYFSWFDEELPAKLSASLQRDIVERQSLVMINGQPTNFDYPEMYLARDRWLTPAGLTFEETHMVDYRMEPAEVQRLLANASVIFLCGGDTPSLHQFLADYQFGIMLQKSSAIILGASAGAINMSRKWLCSQQTNHDVETSQVYEGLGFDDFFFCAKPNMVIDDALLLAELLPLSQEIETYVAVGECVIRVADKQLATMGDLYLISRGDLTKVTETL